MAIRDKLRKKFGPKKNSSSDSSTPGSTSTPRRTDIEYYKPHEIPKSKYRGKVDKAHQEKLEAYSLGDAFNVIRRKSSQALSGTLSPGGTQSQSRRASWMSQNKFFLSTTNVDGDRDGRNIRQKSAVSTGAPKGDTMGENEEDDTGAKNTGIPQIATNSDQPSQTRSHADFPQTTLENTITACRPSSPNNSPFTLEELEQAMARATMRPRRGTAIAPALHAESVAA